VIVNMHGSTTIKTMSSVDSLAVTVFEPSKSSDLALGPIASSSRSSHLRQNLC
jgi:hypothetical protein